jgi:uncharacterized protein (DUF305 family)
VSEIVEHAGAAAGADPDEPQPADDEIVVLPWWHNPVNLVVIAIGLILVMGSLGWVLGNNHAQPDPNSTDVGFLQDMHWHHDQAVEMALIYMSLPGTDPALRQTAEEILVGQNQEIGLMIQMLRDFGKPETNETDTGMAWMGHPTPLDSMPGMATETQLDQLQRASGSTADNLFVQLMTAHHQGGIEMATYAAKNANEGDVRTLARQIAGSQQEEITEMQQLLQAATTS